MLNAHPCNSLIMCLSMTFTLLLVEYIFILHLFIFLNLCLLQEYELFHIYTLLHMCCVFKIIWGSYDSMFVHLILKYKKFNWCINLGELSYFLKLVSFDLIIISSIGLFSFKLVSFASFGISC